MSTTLRDLVSALPEVYQTIYGHPEWDGNVSRDCNERLEKIGQVYDTLSRKLDRPLRVLDLGCAQGFFSLSLASKGASVQGIDFLQENIDVCNALAEEYQDFSLQFAVGRIEDVITQLTSNQYDLAIGLSVFHHMVHQHGIGQVKLWLQRLTESVHGVILELALKEEPLYWGPSQPDDPRELIEQCSFYLQMARFDTHLSDISRPMYLVSNDHLIIGDYCQPFTEWSLHPYAEAGIGHKGSRRYFFSPDVVCKLYYFTTPEGNLLPRESERNRTELDNEIAFLSNPPAGFPAPELILSGHNAVEGWLVMERFPGKLLMEKIRHGEPVDADSLIGQVLEQLLILEKQGLYHDDVRTWNIMVDDEQHARIIDYGSITGVKRDCVWPEDLFQSFAILVNEIVIPQSVSPGFLRPAALSPFNLPAPYANWLFAFWRVPASDWSFALLHALFLKKDELPGIENGLSGTERWIGAQEKVLMHNQTLIYQIDAIVKDCLNRVNDCQDRVVDLEQHIEHDLDQRVALLEQHNQALEQVMLEMKRQFTPVAQPQPVAKAIELAPLPADDLTRQLSDAGDLAAHLTGENARLAGENAHLTGENTHWTSESIGLANELARVASENARLNAHIAALNAHITSILHSRSWRMTAWWRQAGQPIKTVVKQPGGKKVIRYVCARAIGFFNRRPAFKRGVLRLLRISGLYNISLKFYQRCFPVPINEHEIIDASHDEAVISYKDASQRPPSVEDIFLKIKR